MSVRSLLLLAAILAAAPAFGQEDRRDLCPDRPGLGTPACTVEPGSVLIEVGLAGWTLDRTADSRGDSWTFGDALLRAGLTSSLEVQVGWTMLGHARERDRDRATGDVVRRTRTGDVTLALRQNLRNPDGSGFSVALMPYATLPLGGEGVGAGDWGAGVIVPGLSAGWQPDADSQWDLGANMGFNRDSPDVELCFGYARRF